MKFKDIEKYDIVRIRSGETFERITPNNKKFLAVLKNDNKIITEYEYNENLTNKYDDSLDIIEVIKRKSKFEITGKYKKEETLSKKDNKSMIKKHRDKLLELENKILERIKSGETKSLLLISDEEIEEIDKMIKDISKIYKGEDLDDLINLFEFLKTSREIEKIMGE